MHAIFIVAIYELSRVRMDREMGSLQLGGWEQLVMFYSQTVNYAC